VSRIGAPSSKYSYARNRLASKRANKLVWLFSNLRLLKRMQAMEQGQQAFAWEVSEEFEDEEEEEEVSEDEEGEDTE